MSIMDVTFGIIVAFAVVGTVLSGVLTVQVRGPPVPYLLSQWAFLGLYIPR